MSGKHCNSPTRKRFFLILSSQHFVALDLHHLLLGVWGNPKAFHLEGASGRIPVPVISAVSTSVPVPLPRQVYSST